MRAAVGEATFFSCENCQQSSRVGALTLITPSALPPGAPAGAPLLPSSVT